MSLLEITTDLIVLKQTLSFFEKMGFKDSYVESIEKDLQMQQQKYNQLQAEQNA